MSGNGTTLQEVLSWFDNVKKVGSTEWRAACPNCEGRNGHHLYISVGTKKDCVILHCMRDCDTNDIMSAVEKTTADLFFDTPISEDFGKPVPVEGAAQYLDAVARQEAGSRKHTYTDEQGKPTHIKTVKKDGSGHKTAYWQHITNEGKWENGAGENGTPLYNLASLSAGSKTVKTIFVTEGEKDVDTLRDVLGLMATTAGGASNWKARHTEQIKPFIKGKTVVILTDNDAEGERMGEQVKAALAPFAAEVLTVPPTAYWEDAPDKADITDYIEAATAGMSAEDSKAESQEILSQLRGIVKAMQDAGKPEPLVAKRADEFGDVPHQYLWYPYLPLHQYIVMLASSGTGKSIITCGIAACLTTGTPLPTSEIEATSITAPCDVLFISSEDSGAEYKARLLASGADLARVHIIDSDASIGLNLATDATRIAALARATGSRLIVIDPWQAFCGDEIDLNRMNHTRPFLQRVAHLAKEADAAIILISHVNKRAQDTDANNAAAGSSELINASRSAFKVIKPDDDEKNVRVIVHTKSSYAPLGDSVKIRIVENGGMEWAGFSPITKEDLESAARSRKTVTDVTRQKAASAAKEAEEREQRTELAEAIAAIANSTEERQRSTVISLAYKEISAAYGELIFSGNTPRIAIRRATAELMNLGFSVSLTTESGNARKAKYVNPANGKSEIAKGFQLTRLSPYRSDEAEEREI